jgi:tetratricopeptide (TPR) repeat protein
MTLAVILGVTATLVTAFNAAVADPLTTCNDSPDPVAQIQGCTEYIAAGQSTNQNLAVAYLNRAIAHSMTGKQEAAFADFAKAIELDPESPLAPYNRGNLHLDTGKYDLAIADFTRAIEIEPFFALAHYNRGLAYEKAGDRLAAKADYQQTLALDPSEQRAKAHLDHLTE